MRRRRVRIAAWSLASALLLGVTGGYAWLRLEARRTAELRRTIPLRPRTSADLDALRGLAGNDGYYQAGTVSGHLYIDSNGNGAQDEGEPDLAIETLRVPDSREESELAAVLADLRRIEGDRFAVGVDGVGQSSGSDLGQQLVADEGNPVVRVILKFGRHGVGRKQGRAHAQRQRLAELAAHESDVIEGLPREARLHSQ